MLLVVVEGRLVRVHRVVYVVVGLLQAVGGGDAGLARLLFWRSPFTNQAAGLLLGANGGGGASLRQSACERAARSKQHAAGASAAHYHNTPSIIIRSSDHHIRSHQISRTVTMRAISSLDCKPSGGGCGRSFISRTPGGRCLAYQGWE